MHVPIRRGLAALAGLVLAAVTPAAALAAPAPPSAWYQPGAYAGHSGSNDFETVLTSSNAATLATVWSGGGGSAGPLVYGGRVWTFGDDGVLRSREVGTGAASTTTRVGQCRPAQAPPVMSSTVVVVPTVGCGQPALRAFAVPDGHPLWQRPLPRGITSATLRNGVVYATGGRGSVTAVDLADGHVRWTVGSGRHPVLGSAVSDGVLYTSVAIDGIQARRLSDGALLWTHPAGEYDSYIAAVGGRVYIGYVDEADAAGDEVVEAVSKDGTRLWIVSVGESTSTPDVRPTISGGLVLSSSVDGDVVALDADTGTQRWATGTEHDRLSDVTVAGGVAYTVEDGVLYGRALQTGTLLVKRAVGGASGEPVVAAGHVLLGGDGLQVLAPG